MSAVDRIRIPSGTIVVIDGLKFRVAKMTTIEGAPVNVAALKASDPNVARANATIDRTV